MKNLIIKIFLALLIFPLWAQVDGFPVAIGVGNEPLWGAIAIIETDSSAYIAIGSTNDSLYVIETDGSNVSGFPMLLPGKITSKIAWEPKDSAIVIFALTENGYLCRIIWNGATASIDTEISLGTSAKYISPVIDDVRNDGELEVFAAVDTTLYCYSFYGEFLWSANFYSSTGAAVATPACGDINGDGKNEIIVEGYEALFAYNSNGSAVDSFPVELEDAAFSYSAPFLWDYDGDGNCEIFCGAHRTSGDEYGIVFKVDGSDPSLDSPIYTVHGAFGTWVYSSPSIGDMNGDYSYDITFGSINGTVFGITGDGAVSSFGGVALHMAYGHIYGGILLCDLDNEPGPEYIFQMSQESSNFAYMIAMNPNALYIDNFPDTLEQNEAGILTPAVFVQDSSTYIAGATGDGELYLWQIDNLPAAGYKFWTELFGDRRNRSVAIPDAPQLSIELQDSEYSLIWTMSISPDFQKYLLYQSSDSAGTTIVLIDSISDIGDTNYTVAADTLSDSLWFFVIVEDSFGRTSARSVPQSTIDTAAICEKAVFPQKISLTISPSPFNSVCKITAQGAQYIEVSSLDGKRLKTLESDNGVFRFDAQNLPSGILLLRAIDSKGKTIADNKTILMR